MIETRRHHSWRAHMRFLRQTVLGLNRRNSHYIFSLNPITMLPLVDEKVLTKQRLEALQIPHPETYGVIRTQSGLKNLPRLSKDWKRFVLKPSRGSGGGGIVVCRHTGQGTFELGSGQLLSMQELQRHVEEILSGVFALDDRDDTALFEYCIQPHQDLVAIGGNGVADIRFLVVMGVPVLAMLRLPTERSGGRANLHVGGVGVGVDLCTGVTRRGVYRSYLIHRHPDTRAIITGVTLPFWEEMLQMATACYEAVPLGYLGVDIVIDAELGPMVLELNARPGLQIQLANGIGLRPVLEAAVGQSQPEASRAARVALGKQIYASIWELFADT